MMSYQHEYSPWLAIAVLLIGLASVVLLGTGTGALPVQAPQSGETTVAEAAQPQTTRMVLSGFQEVGADLPTAGAIVAVTPAPTSTPVPTPLVLPPLELPNVPVPEGGETVLLTPSNAQVVGWARAADEVTNHFGDFNIFAGTFGGQQHVGAVQFDLSSIPPGSPILYADLTLTGLADQWLGDSGEWRVQLLAEWMNRSWPERNYHWLARSDNSVSDLTPILSPAELVLGRSNTFLLPVEQLSYLEAQLYAGHVAFRMLGPDAEGDNLFGWDSGFGTRTLGRGPILRVVTGGPAPLTPPPSPTPNYVVVTLTPRDAEGIRAAAVRALTATAQSTPLPAGVTPSPTTTPTPLPPIWVTPIIVTNTPTPENAATAVELEQVLTAAAVVNGTATATPPNVWTATPTHTPIPPTATPLPTATPMIVAFDGLPATLTPTSTPEALPAILRGRILFYSDRFGSNALMVMDPDGSNVAVWTGGSSEWIYATAKRNEDLAPDAGARVIVSSEQIRNSQLWIINAQNGNRQQLTHFNQIAYDPVWSPTSNRIAFISPEPGNDELYTINADGSDLQRLTFNEWEWDKHPSWSPDGGQIVFWSNRATRRKQIWIMNADGSNVRNLSNNEYNDWDPVWVK